MFPRPHSLEEVINLAWLARERVFESVASWTEDQLSFKPEDGAWTVSEIFEHLHIVEFMTLQQIWGVPEERATRRLVPITQTDKPLSFFELVSGLNEDFKVKAPAFWWPQGKTSGLLWLEALKSNQRVIEKLPSFLDDELASRIVLPHFLFGPLNAMQWLEFFPFHLDRHVKQIARLRQSEDFPYV